MHILFFFPGILALSSSIDLSNQYYLFEQAQKSQDAAWFIYNQQNTVIEPNLFDFLDNQIIKSKYRLNPENFESNFYLYHVSNYNQTYFDRAKYYFDSLKSSCKCISPIDNCVGYASLDNIYQNSTIKSDYLPSWFFGETLLYLYLTFLANTPNSPIVNDLSQYVFTTEAHPIPKNSNLYELNDLSSV